MTDDSTRAESADGTDPEQTRDAVPEPVKKTPAARKTPTTKKDPATQKGQAENKIERAKSAGAAAGVPAGKTPAPAAKTSVAAADKSVPTPGKSASAAKKSVSAADKSGPAVEKSVPAAKKPVPAAKKSVPPVAKSASVAKQPAPAAKKPVPAAKKSAPTAEKSAPAKAAETKSVPAEKPASQRATDAANPTPIVEPSAAAKSPATTEVPTDSAVHMPVNEPVIEESLVEFEALLADPAAAQTTAKDKARVPEVFDEPSSATADNSRAVETASPESRRGRAQANPSKAPGWRSALGITAGFLATAALLTAGVLWWYSLQGVTLPIFGGTAPSAVASAMPELTTEPSVDPEPVASDEPAPSPSAIAPEGSVGLTEVARTSDGNFFTITSVERIDAQANSDGSAIGSMIRVSLAYANISALDADLMSPTVSVTTGAERAPAAQADAAGTAPFPAWVGAGTVVQASYVFAMDPTHETDMSVTVTYGAGESVTFWGDATMFASGQTFATAGVAADSDASASFTEVEE